jgi:hypothetical protein
VTSAAVSARLCGGRVEVSSAVSETSQTWVNPDGTLTSEQHLGSVRMRQGGAWVPVDATLLRTADGGVAATPGVFHLTRTCASSHWSAGYIERHPTIFLIDSRFQLVIESY